jgi:hypothetical protein
MSDAMERLLERLQSGWQPTPTEIPAEVPQHHLEGWRFIWSVRKRRVLLLGDSPEPPAEPGYQELAEDVLLDRRRTTLGPVCGWRFLVAWTGLSRKVLRSPAQKS